MKALSFLTSLLVAPMLMQDSPGETSAGLDHCTVVWSSAGKNATDSMPLGNGELGVNLWVEENGDLFFYLSRNDSFSEVSQLCKLGKIRVTLSPNPFVSGSPFLQELKLRDTLVDPLLHRTFGGWLTGQGFAATDDRTIATSSPVRNFSLRVAAPCEQTSSAADWLATAEKTALQSADAPNALVRARASWTSFWNRSWVICDAGPGVDVPLNPLPIRIGSDSSGGSRFAGEIGGCRVLGSALAPDASASTPITAATTKIEALDFQRGLTLEAWIKPTPAPSTGTSPRVKWMGNPVHPMGCFPTRGLSRLSVLAFFWAPGKRSLLRRLAKLERVQVANRILNTSLVRAQECCRPRRTAARCPWCRRRW